MAWAIYDYRAVAWQVFSGRLLAPNSFCCVSRGRELCESDLGRVDAGSEGEYPMLRLRRRWSQ